MRTAIVNDIFQQLEADTHEFRQWVDERYKYYSPIGERLGDYAGHVEASLRGLKAELADAQTTIDAAKEREDYKEQQIRKLETQLASVRKAVAA